MRTVLTASERKVLKPPLVLVAGVVFSVSLAAFFRTPILPDLGRDLALTAGQLSYITAAFAIGRLAVDLPSGRVADKRSPHLVLAGAGVLLAIASLSFGLSYSLLQAMVSAAVLGAASAMTNTTGMTQFSSRVTDDHRGAALAIFSMALLSGQTFGPALGGLVAELGGWRIAQFVAGIIGIGVAVVCLLQRGRWGVDDDGIDPARPTDEAARPPDLTRHEVFVLRLIPFAVFFTLASLPNTLIPLIGADDLGLSAATIGLALGIGGLSRFVGAAVTGRISDRRSRKAALIPGLAVMSVGTALLALPPTNATWFASIVLMSIGSTGGAVAATILGDRTPRGRVGRRLSTFRFTSDLGLLFGPLLTAWLFERAGRVEAVAVVAGLLAACAVLATTVRESHPARATPSEPAVDA